MLALGRKAGERVRLFDRLTGVELGSVLLIRVGPGNARLGFEFDSSIEILREELADGVPAAPQRELSAA